MHVDALASQQGGRRPAEFSIDAHGEWFYRGSPIRREGLLRLLEGMLRRASGAYVLDTPEQALRVDVADVPFVVTGYEVLGDAGSQSISFVTSLGVKIPLDAEHPLFLRTAPDGQTKPYVMVREGLEAVLHRNVFYGLAGIAQERYPGGPYGVSSNGLFFPLE